MRNRENHRTSLMDGLRLAIDCMPVQTREAMLAGVRENQRIIVGAYVDDAGGVCPMLAAHRCGGRTDFLSFAKSWDRFTRASGRARRATRRELDVLTALLEDSLMHESGMDLAGAIAHHNELRSDSKRERAHTRRKWRVELEGPSGEIVIRDARGFSVHGLLGVG